MTHVSDRRLSALPAEDSRTLRGAAVIFTLTMFIGSALLFLVQPMVAKLLLPRLGGSPVMRMRTLPPGGSGCGDRA